VLTLALSSTALPLTAIQDLADTRLVQKIAQLPGVGLVTLSGGQKPAVRIQVNPALLAGYGLTLDDVRNVVAAANVNQAKGSLDGRTRPTPSAQRPLHQSAQYRTSSSVEAVACQQRRVHLDAHARLLAAGERDEARRRQLGDLLHEPGVGEVLDAVSGSAVELRASVSTGASAGFTLL